MSHHVPPPPLPTATAYALVSAFITTSYEITFLTAAAVGPLDDGLAAAGLLAQNGWAYWSYTVADPSQPLTVNFVLTARAGDPDMYIAVWPPGAPRYRPSDAPGGSTWQGLSFGSDAVAIPPSDPNACQGGGASSCSYIVGVKCDSAIACRYSLTGFSGDTIVRSPPPSAFAIADAPLPF